MGETVWDCCASEHWADHHVHPMQGAELRGDYRSAASCTVQVPGKTEDHRVEEVGIYERGEDGVPEIEGREEGVAVRVPDMYAFESD